MVRVNMLFSSFEFLFMFLPVVLLGYYTLSSRTARTIWLTLASYFFYGFWNYKFLPLLVLSTYFNFQIGLWLHQAHNEQNRYRLIALGVTLNLAVLGFFKYFYFLSQGATGLLSVFNVHWSAPAWDIVLPVGISFYTFQAMSYVIDVYRKKAPPYEDFWAFANYIALYPQLIAGPIVRHNDLVPQILENEKISPKAENFSKAIYFFVFGIAKKTLIADRIGLAVDQALGSLESFSGVEAWLCALGYTTQLYFDFSGYSDMAVGLGWMLGFEILKNFDSPYKSQSITEFWQRWHLSLSHWLRDYLYIPMGGNRGGTLKTYRNLFLTMLLGGLWHGAGWTYVIWGAYHGGLLAVERVFKEQRVLSLKPPKLICHGLTFLLVVIGWVIFRAPDLPTAMLWYSKMFIPEKWTSFAVFSPSVRDRMLVALVIGLLIAFFSKNLHEKQKCFSWGVLSALVLAFLFYVCLLFLAGESPFLYFQF